MAIVGYLNMEDLEKKETKAPRNPYQMGYGRKIPTCLMVKVSNRWRRVYVALFGNSGTYYITSGKEDWIVIR